VRGLKLNIYLPPYKYFKSHPCGCVDWNFFKPSQLYWFLGRTLVGAWIEISISKSCSANISVAPLWVRGLKFSYQCMRKSIYCRTLVGAWIEIRLVFPKPEKSIGRTLVGAWIEIVVEYLLRCNSTSRTLVGAWIEISRCITLCNFYLSHPCGCVDWNCIVIVNWFYCIVAPLWVRGLK